MKHFLMFSRTGGHCAVWSVKSSSLSEALLTYVAEEVGTISDEGISTDDGHGGSIVYKHVIECIESEVKIFRNLRNYRGFEVKEAHEEHWNVNFAEVFCSENPYDIE